MEVTMQARVSKVKDLDLTTKAVTITFDVTIKIQSGDNLYTLAKKYKTTVDQLVKWNNIADPSKIKAGETLKIDEVSGVEKVKVSPPAKQIDFNSKTI